MTPPAALAAADKINRTDGRLWYRCNNLTADYPMHSEEGWWRVDELTNWSGEPMRRETSYMTHDQLIEFAETLEPTE